MAIAAVKIKLMPSSPETNLEKIKTKAKALIQKSGGKNPNFQEEPIAFGLKAIIILFAWPEQKEIETLEAKLSKIDNVNSAQIIDMRRAIG